jgi:hypothetical protein
MRRAWKLLGWLMLAPLAWLLGEFIVCVGTPLAYSVERTAVVGLPERPVTVAEVAALNRALGDERSNSFYLTLSVICYTYEYVHAVPTADGGLELVHVRPALCWRREETKPGIQETLQQWLAEINRKGERAQ